LINFISKRKNARVVILTARINDSHKHVVYLLKKNKIAVADIIYRKRSELRIPDEEWKRRKVNVLAKKYAKIDLFEDKLDNINHMKSGIDSDGLSFFLVKNNTIKKV
ncbi:MAG: hypothetical protein KGH49_04335, partial [Candidatus Micrarchaeota archaeon]|nr:hypothetical protein [Candidatus Micrarchaeota archaeon]